VTITVAGVLGEFAAFVPGILMKMNVAEIHLRVRGGSIERNVVATAG
jgi:hypothetical protein